MRQLHLQRLGAMLLGNNVVAAGTALTIAAGLRWSSAFIPKIYFPCNAQSALVPGKHSGWPPSDLCTPYLLQCVKRVCVQCVMDSMMPGTVQQLDH